MSAAEDTIANESLEIPEGEIASSDMVRTGKNTSVVVIIINAVLDFLSSVKVGVVTLVILVVLAFLGMIIVQQNVEGFDTYFASLTPAEKWLYGNLGLFDIYHSLYFSLLLLFLSLNIVLASIDRFPSAWSFVATPKLDASRKWLLGQKQSAELSLTGDNAQSLADRIGAKFKEFGLKPVLTEKNGKVYVFGQSGVFNRLGAYIVHVALLLLFMGHFVASWTSFDADVRLAPGQTTNEIEMIKFDKDQKQKYSVGLPFNIICTDIQQSLIDPNGGIEIQNTLDWRTQIKIDDPQYGVSTADVQLNKPFSYRGYRFFQASAITVGNARTMTLELTPQNGGQPVNVTLQRNGTTNLPDGTNIAFDGFFADFSLVNGKPDTKSAEYNNPAVKLNIMTPQGEKKSAYAFAMKLPDNAPVGAPVAGYKWRLADFEKVPMAHVLSIKYDPWHGHFIAWYLGGFGLIGALIFVFFVSHRRVWALIEPKELGSGYSVVVGGNTNRNQLAFDDKFKKLVNALKEIKE